MNEILEKALGVRYVKLHFTLCFPNACTVPAVKASSIRGGIGEMMLRANCIRDRKCEKCDFESECLVQRTFYSKFNTRPEYVTTGESIGYVIECEDYREYLEANDTVKFNLILFGKTIVYLNIYLQALAAFGQQGLIHSDAKFYIQEIKNTQGKAILKGNDIYMKNYVVQTLKEYVDYRNNYLRESPNRIIFQTAVALRYQNEFLREFNMDAIVRAAKRRLYILDCFEDMEGMEEKELLRMDFTIPEIRKQTMDSICTRRYSNRQDSAMYLKGIKGTIGTEPLSQDLTDLLLAAEIFHLGKYTSFGFGRCYLKIEKNEAHF